LPIRKMECRDDPGTDETVRACALHLSRRT
jgi:hypothetical protein